MDPLSTIIQLAYLLAAALFIMGLHDLNSPKTARRGNGKASVGMLVAVLATLLHQQIVDHATILAGMAIGSIIGAIAAQRVKLTAMPQMVGLLNGFGGGASALIATAEFLTSASSPEAPARDVLFIILLALLIGGVTFTGSLTAFGKLQGWVTGSPVIFPFQRIVNALFLVLFLAGSARLLAFPETNWVFAALVCVSLILGLLLVAPIGGADMPVVVSLLNSFSGIAAGAAGFIINNNLLIVSGALVGAAGAILTRLMSKAMNRSIPNILFGSLFAAAAAPGETAEKKSFRSIDAEQAAMMLAYAGSVVIVPGYGLAASRGQQPVRELADQLEKRGVSVKYAIHPVAGRMPGHMNVLLAEAGVPYEKLYDMDDINPEFERTDVVLVIGASDVVNPAARHAKGSALYGMPILDVDRAHKIIVIKRSMKPGFSGSENELFYHEKTMMLFGDAREAVARLVSEVKQL
ncbi:MAG: NAD synthetase [Nitrospirae bacterium GWD2_57_9]|nr:MAG: NAD synthetase [Nitrospirae bacterium GWD2_57_9]